MTRDNSVSVGNIVLLIALAAVWGGAFTLIKVLVADISPLEMAAARLALGALTVLALLRVRGLLRWHGAGLLAPIAVLAMLDTIAPYTLVGWAESRIDSGTASVLISTMPLFTTIFAAATMREERMGPARLTGIVVGFAGVVLLVGSPGLGTGSGGLEQLAVVGAAASYGVGAVQARVLLRRIDAMSLTALKLAIGALIAAAFALGAGEGAGIAGLGGKDALALCALGVVCTGLAFVAYFKLVASIGSVRASTVTYVIPVFGLLFGTLLLGEPLEVRTFLAMALIVSGVAAVMYGSIVERVVAEIARVRRAWSTA